MLRQSVLALLSFGSVVGSLQVPAIAVSSVKDCPYRKGLVAVRVDSNGNCYYKRAAIEGLTVAMTVPRDERPGRRLPNPGGTLLISQGTANPGDVVKDPTQCKSGVALGNDDGTWTCGSGDVKLVSFQLQGVTTAPGCRVIGRSPRGPIIGCGEEVAIDAPSVPEGKQDPSEIYPGLPPAPQKPAGNLIALAEFKPPSRSRTPRTTIGSSTRAFEPEPNDPPTTAGHGTGTRAFDP